jgi:hypothetical protein
VFCKSCFGQTWWKSCFAETRLTLFRSDKNRYFPAPTKNGRLCATGHGSGFGPIPGVRLKNVPKGVSKAVLSDDVKLKLAAHQFGGSKACTTYFRKEKQTACG